MNNKKDSRPINEKMQNHGYWEVFGKSGKLHYSGLYVNGDMVGYQLDNSFTNGEIVSISKRYIIQ